MSEQCAEEVVRGLGRVLAHSEVTLKGTASSHTMCTQPQPTPAIPKAPIQGSWRV